MKRVSLEDAEKQLKDLVAAAERGEDVALTDHDTVVARIVAPREKRQGGVRLGRLRGQIHIDDSFYEDMSE
ncbi:MAG: hypothetical protein U5Q44_11335 [Dehalococcoidia bacterium]|nr:hypothetical protein [Dehalococcoidia bacterium]